GRRQWRGLRLLVGRRGRRARRRRGRRWRGCVLRQLGGIRIGEFVLRRGVIGGRPLFGRRRGGRVDRRKLVVVERTGPAKHPALRCIGRYDQGQVDRPVAAVGGI